MNKFPGEDAVAGIALLFPLAILVFTLIWSFLYFWRCFL
mgnify:CR=1 FL=1